MSFGELMASVVGQQIASSPNLYRRWTEFLRLNNHDILTAPCSRASNIINTPESVLFYALAYQKAHLDAVKAVAATLHDNAEISGAPTRWLVVDFGAGPGTALQAISELHREHTGNPLSATYIHVDRLTEMTTLARMYFDADENVAIDSSFVSVANLDTVSNADLVDWVGGCSHILFVFSYVLCQPTVTSSVAALFASFVVKVCKAGDKRPCYLLMVDAADTRSKWPSVKETLTQAGLTVAAESETRSHNIVYLNLDGTERRRLIRNNNLLCVVSRLEW